MRLIDADAFANRIVSVYGEDGLPKDASLIYELLLNRPTIDAEPVVRCKECRRRGTDECPMYWEEWHISEYGDDWLNMNDYSRDNGFCDWGEKDGE